MALHLCPGNRRGFRQDHVQVEARHDDPIIGNPTVQATVGMPDDGAKAPSVLAKPVAAHNAPPGGLRGCEQRPVRGFTSGHLRRDGWQLQECLVDRMLIGRKLVDRAGVKHEPGSRRPRQQAARHRQRQSQRGRATAPVRHIQCIDNRDGAARLRVGYRVLSP